MTLCQRLLSNAPVCDAGQTSYGNVLAIAIDKYLRRLAHNYRLYCVALASQSQKTKFIQNLASLSPILPALVVHSQAHSEGRTSVWLNHHSGSCLSVGQLVKIRCLFWMLFIAQSPDVVTDAT
jgi:hypothetical protein